MRADEKISVLYIDDESNNLLSFQASFRRKYKIYIANSAAEGMGVLNDHLIHVIIADQRMPHSTGIEFFNIIRKAHPDPVRMLLTGYTDAEAIIDAINKGEIYRYIKKPWDEFELENAIQNAYEIFVTRDKLSKKIDELQKINDELNNLPNPEIGLILFMSKIIFFHDQLNRVINNPKRDGKTEHIKIINNK